jgi:DNA-binding helix-hairpin-helix protein with protein kinase domain
MTPLLQAGQTLQMERAGALLVVGDRIGEGGQGVVHQARLNGSPFAVKWLRPGPGTGDMRKSITALVQRGGPPHRAFVWPIDLVVSRQIPGFGYLMPLLDSRFISLAHLLNERVQPSFRVLADLGRELVDAFAALHSSGLCYRDISFGNLRADPLACEVAVIDVDNIGVDGGGALVKGTGPFMAPEIFRDEALPSTATDLHSLAVLLFYLFMHGHPLLGSRADSSYAWDAAHISEAELLSRNLGVNPLFVFDPADRSNAPPPGDPVLTWWDVYPDEFRRVFAKAFTTGLRDASLHGRVTEGTWRRALLRLSDCVTSCSRCGAAAFHDSEQPGRTCWDCGGVLPVPHLLKMPGGTLVLAVDAAVTSHHLSRDRDYRSRRAIVEPHPAQPGHLALRNLMDKPWVVVPEGEEPKIVAPGQRLAVRPMTIEFGVATGQIMAGREPMDMLSAACGRDAGTAARS